VQLFVCPSRFITGRMAAAGVFPDRLRWVPHFVASSSPDLEQPRDGVLFAGRLAEEKGVDTLIDAVGGMEAPVHLDIAGEGPEGDQLRTLADQRAPGRVTFHGRVDQSQVEDLMARAAVVAVPSRWYENQPMVVLEAFARGVPVVATDLGGSPELVRHGTDGFLVAPDDPAALATALAAVIADPARARAMGKAARERAETDFAPDVHLGRLHAVYHEATALVGSGR
jgi:glycosyltransferase involved in cell wall biosynthesis